MQNCNRSQQWCPPPALPLSKEQLNSCLCQSCFPSWDLFSWFPGRSWTQQALLGGKRGFQTRSNSQVPQCTEMRMARALSLRCNTKAKALHKKRLMFYQFLVCRHTPLPQQPVHTPDPSGSASIASSATQRMRTLTRRYGCAHCSSAADDEGHRCVSVRAAASSVLHTPGMGTSAACRSFPCWLEVRWNRRCHGSPDAAR